MFNSKTVWDTIIITTTDDDDDTTTTMVSIEPKSQNGAWDQNQNEQILGLAIPAFLKPSPSLVPFNYYNSLFFCHAGSPNITELSIEPSITVREGENVSIQCSAEGNPPPKIILRRKSDSADMGSYSEGRILLLPSVTFLNGGDYECIAENKFGKSKSEITLNVECEYVYKVFPII